MEKHSKYHFKIHIGREWSTGWEDKGRNEKWWLESKVWEGGNSGEGVREQSCGFTGK